MKQFDYNKYLKNNPLLQEDTSNNINESIDPEQIFNLLLLSTFATSAAYASGIVSNVINKAKEKWNDYKYNTTIKPIVDRLRNDNDVVSMIKSTPKWSRQNIKAVKNMIMGKLNDKEKRYLHKVFNDLKSN